MAITLSRTDGIKQHCESCRDTEGGEGDAGHGQHSGAGGQRRGGAVFINPMCARVVEATRRSPDRGLGYLQGTRLPAAQGTRLQPAAAPTGAGGGSSPPLVGAARGMSNCGIPQVPSTLWNAMIAPLLPLHVAGFLWYVVVPLSLEAVLARDMM